MRSTPQQRFWAKVNKDGPLPPGYEELGACWIWTASCRPCNGVEYGQFFVDGKNHYTHRLSYEWATGEIAPGVHVDHRCHVSRCVRPTHLQAGTRRQNTQNRRGANSNSKSGIRGVYWITDDRRWCGSVADQKTVHRAYFDNSDDAAAWAAAKRVELGFR